MLKKAKQLIKPWPDVKHGSNTSYSHGCRCANCTNAHRLYQNNYNKQHKHQHSFKWVFAFKPLNIALSQCLNMEYEKLMSKIRKMTDKNLETTIEYHQTFLRGARRARLGAKHPK